MKNSTANNFMTRRQVLITGIQIAAAIVPTSLLFGCGEAVDSQKSDNELDTRLHGELVDASKPASAGGQWTELEFNALIDSMGEDSLKRTSKTLEISPALVENYASTTIMKKEIRKHIASRSNSLLSGRDPDKIQYHERVLLPTARKLNVEETQIDTYDTLQLERAIYNRVFEDSWTSLNENERIGFLEQSGWNLERSKVISLAALSGAGIIAGLSAAVDILGFGFYIGMSNGLFALAGSMGITLPFLVYTGASTAIALATGPIGWVAAAILAGIGIYQWIKSNKKTDEADMLKTVLHIHNYRISAMQEANIAFPSLSI